MSAHMSRRALLAGASGLVLAACSPTRPASTPPASVRATSATPVATTAVPSPTPAAPTTPAPYPGLGIEALRQERWGTDGEIQVVRDLTGESSFTRHEINYRADGITIDGFMNVPAGAGPFPVVILCHGFMPPDTYDLLTYTTEHADAFARAGYLVVHPSCRNHRGSGTGPNPYRVGYARDVLHLIPMARRLPQADRQRVAIWGHSMGGGPVMHALSVMPDQLSCAVAYGAVSPDETTNWNSLAEKGWLPHLPDLDQLKSPAEDPALYAAMSSSNYFQDLRVPVQIHHGGQDEQVNLQNAYDLDALLNRTGTPHELYVYPGQLHNLAGQAKQQMWQRCLNWFAAHRG